MPVKADSHPLATHIAAWMEDLSKSRPVFHSEIDFQLALSREMLDHGVKQVRLERRLNLPEPLRGKVRPEIDIMAILDGSRIAIELKYPKERFSATLISPDGPEDFDLRPSGAFDEDASAIWHDAERIEQLLRHGMIDAGAAIALTHFTFWDATKHREGTKAHDFRLWSGRRVQPGLLEWHNAAASYATDPVRLTSYYDCRWQTYSTPEQSQFRYLILEPETSVIGASG
ncbi:hypothetical protein [Rhodococcus erythropolis]|uniref:hypothetical protein n=1 Tax=Rhodococcus erythropolis TaxID=1833 RepID=UPI001BE62FCF|nr:hypothetical protein [Rhodococcus erythropolis]MBT2269799.1 hypothetical protein [Rhodococcus erythropolis]